MNHKKRTPESCANRARKEEAKGNWKEACAWWNSAYAVTLGHKRREQYEAEAERCAAKLGLHPSFIGYAPKEEETQA